MAKKDKLVLRPGWAVYLRTSNKEVQNPKSSQERQRYNIDTYLINPSNIPTIEEYVDTKSGLDTNRPEYQRMLQDARVGKFSHVAVESPDRFSREVAEATRAFNELKELGIQIRFANNPSLESDQPMAEMMIHMAFMLSQFESSTLSARVKGGQLTKIRSGGALRLAPDGYRNVELKTEKRNKMQAGRYERWVEPDPEQFKVWRKAWDLLLTDRYTLKQICEELHRLGYTFRSGRTFVTMDDDGKKSYARNTLSRIFKNWFYAGWYVSEARDIEPKTQRGGWTPVVTTEEFERGLEILDSRNRRRTSTRRQTYLLTSLLYVQTQDKRYRLSGSTPNASRKGGGTSYYRYAKQGIYIMCRTVDEQIPDVLRMIEVDPDMVPFMREHFERHLSHKLKPNKTHAEKLEQELASVKQQRKIAYREYVQGVVIQEEWRAMAANLQYRRQILENELSNMDREQSVILHDLDTALEILHRISELYARLEVKQQRELLRLVVNQFIVDEQGIITEVVLHPPFLYVMDVQESVKKRNYSGRPKSGLSNGKHA